MTVLAFNKKQKTARLVNGTRFFVDASPSTARVVARATGVNVLMSPVFTQTQARAMQLGSESLRIIPEYSEREPVGWASARERAIAEKKDDGKDGNVTLAMPIGTDRPVESWMPADFYALRALCANCHKAYPRGSGACPCGIGVDNARRGTEISAG